MNKSKMWYGIFSLIIVVPMYLAIILPYAASEKNIDDLVQSIPGKEMILFQTIGHIFIFTYMAVISFISMKEDKLHSWFMRGLVFAMSWAVLVDIVLHLVFRPFKDDGWGVGFELGQMLYTAIVIIVPTAWAFYLNRKIKAKESSSI